MVALKVVQCQCYCVLAFATATEDIYREFSSSTEPELFIEGEVSNHSNRRKNVFIKVFGRRNIQQSIQ